MQLKPLVQINQSIDNLSIKQKMSLGYGIALSIVFVGTFSGFMIGDYYLHQASEQKIQISGERRLLNHLRLNALSLQPIKNNDDNSQETKDFKKVKSLLLERIATTNALIKQLNGSISNSSLINLKPALTKYQTNLDKYAQTLSKANTIEDLQDNFTSSGLKDKTLEFSTQLFNLINSTESEEAKVEKKIADIQILRLVIIIFSISISLVSAFFAAKYTVNNINNLIQELNKNIQNIKLSHNLESSNLLNNNEIGIISSSLNQLMQYINKLVEEQKKARAEVNTANEIKAKFLANISHELRTPLNGILGSTQTISRSQNLTQDEKRSINTIHQCAFHLLTLVNDILDFSTIETDQLKINPQDFHLPSLIQGIVEIYELQAQQKSLKFIYQSADNLPTGIHVDKNRLRQVLINLLNNAIKFTEKGYVRLKIDVINPATNSSVMKIRFQIDDTGVGMSSEQIQKIFLPFEQLGNRNNKADGIGLGLPLSQKIIELMGGNIEVKSKPGIGSRFEFEIPFQLSDNWTETSTITKKGKLIGYSGEKRRILVIDDSWDNRSVILSLLEPLGFYMMEASNAEDGLYFAVEYKPDLIISDLEMPVVNGWEFIKRLRQSDIVQNTPIILSSADVLNIDKQKVVSAGGNDFLAKPIITEELYRMISQQLQLEWIYASAQINPSDNSTVILTNEIVIPTVSELVELLEYVKKGKIKGIKQELEKIALLDEKYKLFVNKLSAYVETFNIQKIRQFLQDKLGTEYDRQ